MTDFDPPRAFLADTSRHDLVARPLRVGPWLLRHRLVMAPSSTGLAIDGLPTPTMAAFYGARALSGGLVVSEPACTELLVSNSMPGLRGAEQANAWRLVTRAVQASGGVAIAQLCRNGPWPSVDKDIDAWLDDLRRAAEDALDAGFDGVEMREANSEALTLDERWTLLSEAIATLSSVWEADRVGLRLGPRAALADWTPVLARAEAAAVPYLHVMASLEVARALRDSYTGCLLVSGSTDAASLLALGVDLVGVDPSARLDLASLGHHGGS